MKKLTSLVFVLLGIFGSYGSPHGRPYLILPQGSHYPYGEQLVLLKNDVIPQGPAFFGRNGLVFLKNNPAEAGYLDPTYPLYHANTPVQDEQPSFQPEEPPVDSKPVPEEKGQTPENSKETPKDVKPERLEMFGPEPDAELIPDDVERNSPPVQPVQPQVPRMPYPGTPGLVPGRNFYFITGQPQFVHTYPQVPTSIQPTFRYPSLLGYPQQVGGYPQQYYIYQQPGVQTHPGQTVLLYNDPSSNLLRSNQVQKLDVPPLPSISKEHKQDENVEEFKIEGRIRKEEKGKDIIPPLHTNSKKSNDEDKPSKSGEAALAFSRYLQSDNKAATDNESVVISAAESPKEDSKKKVEIVHADLKSSPSLAETAPHGVAVAGNGGSAQSAPRSSSIAGPAGLAVSSPIATALSGTY